MGKKLDVFGKHVRVGIRLTGIDGTILVADPYFLYQDLGKKLDVFVKHFRVVMKLTGIGDTILVADPIFYIRIWVKN